MDTIQQKAKDFVIDFFNKHLDNKYLYHNISHTQFVVKKVQELCEGMAVSKTDTQLLTLAAWLHDTGYIKGAKGHEEESVNIAIDFLKSNAVSDTDIASISELIRATEMHYMPKTTLENIIRDADSAHLGNKDYEDLSELLRKEWELTDYKNLSDAEWFELNLRFLTEHKFHTNYASANWDKTKGKNISRQIKKQKKLAQDNKKLKQKKAELDFKKSKIELPERGIETMFRVALRNHITLSDIADTKANILLSVNAVIISVALSNLLPKLDNPSNQYLIIPTAIFLLFTVVSIVLSILATRPNITKGRFTKEDVANKKVNLLFFGNFHQMKLDDFEWAMDEMMQDRDYLYSSLTKDLYFLGLVLNRKYGLLRTTYTVFMIGIIVSVIAFAIAFQYA